MIKPEIYVLWNTVSEFVSVQTKRHIGPRQNAHWIRHLDESLNPIDFRFVKNWWTPATFELDLNSYHIPVNLSVWFLLFVVDRHSAVMLDVHVFCCVRLMWLKTCHADVVAFLNLSVYEAVSWFLTTLFGYSFYIASYLFLCIFKNVGLLEFLLLTDCETLNIIKQHYCSFSSLVISMLGRNSWDLFRPTRLLL